MSAVIKYKCKVVMDVETDFATEEDEGSIGYLLTEDIQDAGWCVENMHVSFNKEGIKLNHWENGFTCGVAWACALLARHGHLSADQVWHESNMDEQDLDICDPGDAEWVRKALNGE